jgi:hypothetical protein
VVAGAGWRALPSPGSRGQEQQTPAGIVGHDRTIGAGLSESKCASWLRWGYGLGAERLLQGEQVTISRAYVGRLGGGRQGDEHVVIRVAARFVWQRHRSHAHGPGDDPRQHSRRLNLREHAGAQFSGDSRVSIES